MHACKVMEELPRDGIALFQTALVHVKEDKRSGKLSMSRSDGECKRTVIRILLLPLYIYTVYHIQYYMHMCVL